MKHLATALAIAVSHIDIHAGFNVTRARFGFYLRSKRACLVRPTFAPNLNMSLSWALLSNRGHLKSP